MKILQKYCKFWSFLMRYHKYIKILEPEANEILKVKMKPTNKIATFAVVAIGIYFLVFENNDLKVEILDDKAVNLGDWMGHGNPILSKLTTLFP